MKRWLSVLTVLTACIAALVITASAAEQGSGFCGVALDTDPVYWTVDGEGTLTISGTGAMADYRYAQAPWNDDSVYTIKRMVVEDGVTRVGNYAMYGHDGVEEVILGADVESIGEQAFAYCYALREIDIPASVESIGNYTFGSCSAMGRIFFRGAQAPEIDSNAFPHVSATVYCPASWEVTDMQKYGGSLTWISRGDGTDFTAWELKNGVLTLSGPGATADYTAGAAPWYAQRAQIKSLVVESDITGLGSNLFYGCTELKDIIFKGGAPAIAANTFSGVTATARCNEAYSSWTDGTKVNYGGTLTWVAQTAGGKCNSSGTTPTWVLWEDGLLEISGTGALMEYSTAYNSTLGKTVTNAPWGNCAADLTKVVIREGVTGVGKCAFYNCTALESVTLPASVTTVGQYAFYGCTGLTDLTLSEGLQSVDTYSFGGCTALKSVTLPASMTAIGDCAFYQTGLTAVSVPAGVKTIGHNAFSGCTDLAEVTLNEGLQSISYNAFGKTALTEIRIPASVTDLTLSSFSNMSALVEISVAEGSSLFRSEDGVLFSADGTTLILFPKGKTCESYTVPSGVTAIGASAFAGCKVKYVDVADTVTAIGANAFDSSTTLKAVFLPGGLDIGDSAFAHCGNLDWTVYKDAPPTAVGSNVFSWAGGDCLYSADESGWNDYFRGRCGPSDAQWYPFEKWGTCGDGMLWWLNDGTLNIAGSGAMDDYAAGKTPWYAQRAEITDLSIQKGVTAIGKCAFYRCAALSSVRIPASVTELGVSAFSMCSGLKSVIFEGSAPTIGKNAFYKVNAAVYAPANGWDSADKVNYGGSLRWGSLVARGACGVSGADVRWELNDEGVLTIFGKGSMASYGDYQFEDNYASPWDACGKPIYTVVVEEGVTGVGQFAFYGRSGLKKVLLPEGLSGIGSYAFSGCYGLESVELPDSLKYIGARAFVACYGLETIDLPEGLETIGHHAFQSAGLTGELVLPDGLLEVENGAFYSCSDLTAVTIPAGVTSVGENAFGDCYILKTVWFKGTRDQWTALNPGEWDIPYAYSVLYGQAPVVTAGLRASDNKPRLTWTAVEGAQKYEIWRSLSEEGTYSKMFTTTGTSYANTSAAMGKTYYYKVRPVRTDGYGAPYSETVRVTTPVALAITAQPKSVSAVVGSTAKFTVTAQGGGLTYQWQYRTTPTGTWKNATATGNKTATLSVPATESRDGYQYRCKVTAGTATVYSNAVTLTVDSLAVTGQPKSATVNVGDTVKFTVTAVGDGLTYQWQYRISSTGTWKNSGTTGNKTATLTVTTNIKHNGYQYRCKVTDGSGNSLFSNAADLTVKSALSVTVQPKDIVKASGTAKFTVTAEGSGLTYQWQYRISDSAAWKSATATGNKTATLNVPATASRNGYQYRCKVTDANGSVVYSDAAALTVFGIVTQPVSVDAEAGTTAKFTVKAVGDGLTYQWQYRTSSTGTWKSATATGNKTATLSVPATASRDGYQYRCAITGEDGSVKSAAVTLNVE